MQRSMRVLRVHAVALLEFLSGPAGAWIVAPDLFTGAPLRGFRRFAGAGHARLLQLPLLAPLEFLFQ